VARHVARTRLSQRQQQRTVNGEHEQRFLVKKQTIESKTFGRHVKTQFYPLIWLSNTYITSWFSPPRPRVTLMMGSQQPESTLCCQPIWFYFILFFFRCFFPFFFARFLAATEDDMWPWDQENRGPVWFVSVQVQANSKDTRYVLGWVSAKPRAYI